MRQGASVESLKEGLNVVQAKLRLSIIDGSLSLSLARAVMTEGAVHSPSLCLTWNERTARWWTSCTHVLH